MWRAPDPATLSTCVLAAAIVAILPLPGAAQYTAQAEQEVEKASELSLRPTSTMTNSYRLVENWPTLPQGQEWGAAIGLIPDDSGGLWMLFRSEPPIVYVNADGQVTKRFGEGLIVQAHGFCMDN